jgi:hypothetical protein
VEDFLLDEKIEIIVEPRVPFWLRVMVPEKDLDNWESKILFKFEYTSEGEVSVYGSDRHKELFLNKDDFYWGNKIE